MEESYEESYKLKVKSYEESYKLKVIRKKAQSFKEESSTLLDNVWQIW